MTFKACQNDFTINEEAKEELPLKATRLRADNDRTRALIPEPPEPLSRSLPHPPSWPPAGCNGSQAHVVPFSYRDTYLPRKRMTCKQHIGICTLDILSQGCSLTHSAISKAKSSHAGVPFPPKIVFVAKEHTLKTVSHHL